MAAEDYLFGMDDDTWGDEPAIGPFFPNARHDEVANLLRRGRNAPKGLLQPGPVWTTGAGERMYLTTMEESHIRNTIAYIKRKTEEWKATRQQILRERNRDLGEYRINNASGEQWITMLLAELDRRGLTNV